MKIYISGKMTSKKNFGREIFAQVAEQLRALGHEVINPCETTEAKFGKDVLTRETGDLAHEKYHGVDRCEVIAQDLVNVCRSEMIVMIGDDWQESTGARAEWAAAVATNKMIRYLNIDETWRYPADELIEKITPHKKTEGRTNRCKDQ